MSGVVDYGVVGRWGRDRICAQVIFSSYNIFGFDLNMPSDANKFAGIPRQGFGKDTFFFVFSFVCLLVCLRLLF